MEITRCGKDRRKTQVNGGVEGWGGGYLVTKRHETFSCRLNWASLKRSGHGMQRGLEMKFLRESNASAKANGNAKRSFIGGPLPLNKFRRYPKDREAKRKLGTMMGL
jgi:hypothetical protein